MVEAKKKFDTKQKIDKINTGMIVITGQKVVQPTAGEEIGNNVIATK